MRSSQDYKEAVKAYQYGFIIGAFTGIVFCIVTAKTILSLPVILGLLCGAVAFDRKIKENGND